MHLDKSDHPLLVAEPDTYDSIPAGYYDFSDAELEQVGGGRRGPRRSISPSNQTPTRLRPRIKPTSRLLENMNMPEGGRDRALTFVKRAMDARQAQPPAPLVESHISEFEIDKGQSFDEYLEEDTDSFEPLPLPPPPRPGYQPQGHSAHHARPSEQPRSKDERPCLSPFSLPHQSPSPCNLLERESPHPAVNASPCLTSQCSDESDNSSGQHSSMPPRSHQPSPILLAPPSSPCSGNPPSSKSNSSAHSKKLAEILAANRRLAPKSPTLPIDQMSAPSPGHCTETSHRPAHCSDHTEVPAPSFNVNIIPPTPATQKVTGGRPNKAISKLFADKFDEIDKIFSGLAEQSGRSVQKILTQYNRRHSCVNYSGNAWNMYQRYFAENLEQELARLPDPLPPLKEPCSAAFSQFQVDHKDSWRGILSTWCDLVDLDTAGMTPAHRKKEFLKHAEALAHVAERGMRDGFETAILCCGNVVNDDGQLGYIQTTEGLEDFWKVRFNRDEDNILGHLKAHAFNLASLSIIKNEDPYPEKDPVLSPPVNEASDPSCSWLVSRTTPEPQGRRDTVEIQALQKALIARAQDSGLDLVNKSRQFPWKTMLAVLANAGYQLFHWPADQCPFPGDPAPKGRRGKGITGLLKEQINALQCSLQDPNYPLTFSKYSGSTTDLVNGRQPVIIGAPPKRDDRNRVKTSHALRQFVDASTDNEGPAALKPGGGITTIIRKRATVQQATDTAASSMHDVIEIRSSSSVSPARQQTVEKSFPSRKTRRKSRITVISDEESCSNQTEEVGEERMESSRRFGSSKAGGCCHGQQREEINYYVNEDTEPGEFPTYKRKSTASSLTMPKKARLMKSSADPSANSPPFTQAQTYKGKQLRYASPDPPVERATNPSPTIQHESSPSPTSDVGPDVTVTLSKASRDTEPSPKAGESATPTAGAGLSTGSPSTLVSPSGSDTVSSPGLSDTNSAVVYGSCNLPAAHVVDLDRNETLISTMVAPLLEAALTGAENSTEAETSLPSQTAGPLEMAEVPPLERVAEPPLGHQVGGGVPYSLYADHGHGIYPFHPGHAHYANAAGAYPYGMPNMMPYGARMDYIPAVHQQTPYTSQGDPSRSFPFWQPQQYAYNPQPVTQQRGGPSTSQDSTYPPVSLRTSQPPSQPLQCEPHAYYPVRRSQPTSQHPSFGTAAELHAMAAENTQTLAANMSESLFNSS
ncbi:hypothetical protein JOM56_015529 [Amanita muscaria]